MLERPPTEVAVFPVRVALAAVANGLTPCIIGLPGAPEGRRLRVAMPL